MDWPIIEQKLESLRRSILRVKEKCPANAAAFGNDFDVGEDVHDCVKFIDLIIYANAVLSLFKIVS
jgi:hypothetical protein